MNIYQIFTRLFRVDTGMNKPYGSIQENGCSKFNHFTDRALFEIRKMGITHIWFTGIIRHASCTSYSEFGLLSDNPQIVKGMAGSPYAIKDYFDVDPDLAENIPNRMEEFEQLVKRCHSMGLKIIIDFVPNHVSRQYYSQKLPEGYSNLGSKDNTQLRFHPSNNFYYVGEKLNLPTGIDFPYNINAEEFHEIPAKATGNDVFHPSPSNTDWYETVKLNYGVDYENNRTSCFDPLPDTWIKMSQVLDFWANKGVDAFRVDMAEMVPVEFWHWAIAGLKKKHQGVVFIAEVYNPSLYQGYTQYGGFDCLYDKEQFYNYTRSILTSNASTRLYTQCWNQQEGLGKRLVRFLENHDEQRIASPQFCGNPWRAIPAMIVAATMHPGPLMLYFGQEIGEEGIDNEGFSGIDGRTSIFDYWRMNEYQNWIDAGNFNSGKLSSDRQNLRQIYVNLLNFRNIHKDVLEGEFYDLMYVNQQNLNPDSIYAFLRYQGNKIILVVVNFDNQLKHSFRLGLPAHAFEMIGIDKNMVLNVTEQISGTRSFQTTVESLISNGMEMEINSNNGLIFCLSVI